MIIQFLERKKKEFLEKYQNGEFESKEKLIIAIDKYFNANFFKNENGESIVSSSAAKEIMELLRSGEIPLILTKEDVIIGLDIYMFSDHPDYRKNPFVDISDIVAIHKTKIPPINDTIITPENSGVRQKIGFDNPYTGKKYEIPYLTEKDTIHFTLNAPVQNHEFGNDWDSYKYAVVVSIDELDKEKICDVKSDDTYIDGNAELGKHYYLFCPLGEREKMQQLNPNATIIEYDGISLNQAISTIIVCSGRKLEPYGGFGWGRDTEDDPQMEDDQYLREIIEREEYPYLISPWYEKEPMLHSESKYMARRMWKREYRAIVALMECLKKEKINIPDDIIATLLKYCGVYNTPGTPKVTLEDYKETVIPILEEGGYKIEDGFFDALPDLDDTLKIIQLPNFFKIPKWENELRNRVIQLLRTRTPSKTITQGTNEKRIDDG